MPFSAFDFVWTTRNAVDVALNAINGINGIDSVLWKRPRSEVGGNESQSGQKDADVVGWQTGSEGMALAEEVGGPDWSIYV